MRLFGEWIAIGDCGLCPEALIGGVYAIKSSEKSALCRETGIVVCSFLDIKQKSMLLIPISIWSGRMAHLLRTYKELPLNKDYSCLMYSFSGGSTGAPTFPSIIREF